MSDLNNGDVQSPAPAGPPKKKFELSTEHRLLIAFILMGAVLFLTPYFYKDQTIAPAAKKSEPAATSKAAANSKPSTPAPSAAPVESTPVAAGKEEAFVLDTDVCRVEFTNRGATVKSWTLKKYLDENKKPLELVNIVAAPKAGNPLSLVFRNQKPSVDLNAALYAVKPQPDRMGVDFEFSSGRALVRKSFRFRKDSYLAQVTSEVFEGGAPVPHLLAWRGGFGDLSVLNAVGTQHSIYFDSATNKLEVQEAKAANDGPVLSAGMFSFAGIEDAFFAAVFLPTGNGSVEMLTVSDQVSTKFEPKEENFVGAAVGGEGRNALSLFVGPKDIDILRAVNPKLEQAVDFGWFSFIAKPLFLAVHWVSDSYTRNYGWAIVLVTVFINFALFPLKLTSMKSMKKMQSLKPRIDAINEKYKNVGMRDPKKQEQNQEVMALYKVHGVNPMGGCVPMALQVPFFIAFYKVLSVAIEMRHASWLWVDDLSAPEKLPIHILPIAMIASQFVMQKMTPVTGGDPAQQKMMLFMPLVFGFMFYNMSSGLVLYWLTGNLVGIAQQLFFNKTATASVAVQSVEVTRKKKSGK
ncbi:MAG: membrane protein insertase YidC [Bryobacterales bacterium]|nr:membrane protein insertase YidC [Bryobacterales bacterium]